MNYVAKPAAHAVGAGRDLSAQRQDGSEIPAEIRLNPLTIDGQTFIFASMVDITERTKAEDELRLSEGRFCELFEDANDLIQAVSPEGRFFMSIQRCAAPCNVIHPLERIDGD